MSWSFIIFYFLLAQRVNLSETIKDGKWDGGNGWRPIPSFSGVLDGNGYQIKNMHIFGQIIFDEPTNYQSGFILVNSGTIKDLHFTDVNVNVDIKHNRNNSQFSFGTICAVMDSPPLNKDFSRYSHILRCSVSGTININVYNNDVDDNGSTNFYIDVSVGGLVGSTGDETPKYNNPGYVKIEQSYNNASIKYTNTYRSGTKKHIIDRSYVGGIVGVLKNNLVVETSSSVFYAELSLLQDCYNNGSIKLLTENTEYGYAGGIVGDFSGELDRCLNLKDGSLFGRLSSPESVKLECIKMLKTCMKSRVSGILSYIFSAPIWCKFNHRKF